MGHSKKNKRLEKRLDKRFSNNASLSGLDIAILVIICVFVVAVIIFVIVWAIFIKKQKIPGISRNASYGIKEPSIFIILTSDGIVKTKDITTKGLAKSHFKSRYTKMKVKALKFFDSRYGLSPDKDGVHFDDYTLKDEVEYKLRIFPEAITQNTEVKENGFMITVTKDTTSYGTYGGMEGKNLPAGTILYYSEYEMDVEGKLYRMILESYCPTLTKNKIHFRVGESPWGVGNAEVSLEIIHLYDKDYYIKMRNFVYFPWSPIECDVADMNS